jgi:hypothetical protein
VILDEVAAIWATRRADVAMEEVVANDLRKNQAVEKSNPTCI